MRLMAASVLGLVWGLVLGEAPALATVVFYRYQYLDETYPQGYCSHASHIMTQDGNPATNTREPIVCVSQLVAKTHPASKEPLLAEHIVQFGYNQLTKICYDFSQQLAPGQLVVGKLKLTFFCAPKAKALDVFQFRSEELITAQRNPTLALADKWRATAPAVTASAVTAPTPPTGPTVTEPTGPTVTEPTAPTVTEPAAPTVTEPAGPTVTAPTAPTVTAPTVTAPAAPTVTAPTAPTVTAPTVTEPAAPTVTAPTASAVTAPDAMSKPAAVEPIMISTHSMMRSS